MIPETTVSHEEREGCPGANEKRSFAFLAAFARQFVLRPARSVGTFNNTVNSSGLISFMVNPPASPFVIGPFGWMPSGPSRLDWNIRNGALSFTLAGGSLTNSFGSVANWPNASLSFPSVTFDSRGDFEQTITLPSFSFHGIGLGNAADAADRYVSLRRVDGVFSCAVRDQRDFFGSTMSLGFDISSSGSASGFFKGGFGVDFGPPIRYVYFGGVNRDYNSGASPYQFTGQLRAVGNDFRIQFGSGGGRACHLWCNGSNCSETICLSWP